jgi:hypothetical protein
MRKHLERDFVEAIVGGPLYRNGMRKHLERDFVEAMCGTPNT